MSDPAQLTYVVSPVRPEAHLFEVRMLIPPGSGPELTLSMPAWIPGSYMIRDFARNVVQIAAEGPDGALPLQKRDKQTWRLTGAGGGAQVSYRVYAHELTVRSAHLDTTHGYFNGPSLFLRVAGLDDRPCRMQLLAPPGAAYSDWRVATSMRRDGGEPWGFGDYVADNYEDLIDHPVEMGRFDLVETEVRGVPHWMVLSGRHRADLPRLARDLAAVCEAHAAMFGELPVDRYLFLTQVVGNGYGGLEHCYSTSLISSRGDLPEATPSDPAKPVDAAPPSDGYRRFLGLCSHEYFHLWNVKRIRPAVLAENGLDREAHTRLLWAFEGITSYYDDLALVRCGLFDAKAYLQALAENITRVMRNPGRLRQTLAESSFDAWTKFYKQDENSPNAIVSYYGKGALAALALDLTIRRETDNARSLDDVMRALWQRHGRTGVGVPERGVEAIASEVSGIDLSAFFDHALDSAEDLDLAPLLAAFGVGMRLRPAAGPKDAGGVPERFDAVSPGPDIGLRLQPDLPAGVVDAQIGVVLDGRPAQLAGLSAGDVICAIDGLRADRNNADELLRRARIDEPLAIHAFRRDQLMQFEVVPQPAPADTCELMLLPDADADARSRRQAWLGSAGA